jgi:hypothetical protein
LQGPPKFTQTWDFWFENKPSGNPANQFRTFFYILESKAKSNHKTADNILSESLLNSWIEEK